MLTIIVYNITNNTNSIYYTKLWSIVSITCIPIIFLHSSSNSIRKLEHYLSLGKKIHYNGSIN